MTEHNAAYVAPARLREVADQIEAYADSRPEPYGELIGFRDAQHKLVASVSFSEFATLFRVCADVLDTLLRPQIVIRNTEHNEVKNG